MKLKENLTETVYGASTLFAGAALTATQCESLSGLMQKHFIAGLTRGVAR